LIGITNAIGNISGAFVPYIAGYVFDSLGSYTMVFLALALLLLVAGIFITTIKKPAEA
jgi:nitrate/nitrite transporter NarK